MPQTLPTQYPAIPAPTQDPQALLQVALRLKEAVELLTGQRSKNLAGIAAIANDLSSSYEVTVTKTLALTQRVTSLGAEIVDARGGRPSLTARFVEVDTARVDGDLALAQRAATLEAQMAGTTASPLKASITTADQARVDGDSALAARASTLETNVGTNTATLNTFQTSIDGIAVKYGVTGTINGVTGGFVFGGVQKLDGSVTYNMEFNSNVTINGNLFVSGTITTPKVALQAVNNIQSGQVTGNVGVGTGAWVDLAAVSVAGGDGAYTFIAAMVRLLDTVSTTNIFWRVVSDTQGEIIPQTQVLSAGVITAAFGYQAATPVSDTLRVQVFNGFSSAVTFGIPSRIFAEVRKR